MTSSFFFFSDPAVLSPQTTAQAFGPAAAAAGKDRFRVTDLHGSTALAPAFAISDGLVCAQTDDQGTLTLILKPSQQPPFDFPAIRYILYKGIDPQSLLTSSGTIDVAQQGANDLIAAIKTTWELADNGNTGAPSRACLGLHLNPTDYPATENPARFADTEPLDRLFYEGDPAIQLPLVRGGWRLGAFSRTSPFGIEMVVDRLGRRPKIGLARKAENVVEVDTLSSGADAAEVFRHWDAKEAILDHIDPCAFWGAFFATKLLVWSGANSRFDKLSGNAIYQTVLRGAAAGTGNFANRNRAYLDIRNEHGNSLNYYQEDGPTIQLTLAATADIDACEVNYYAAGWPSFAIDNASLPSGTTSDKIDVRFALPKTANTEPLIYVSVGYRGGFRRLKDRKRFLDRPRRAAAVYLDETSITIPLADDGGVKRIFAGYQKLHRLKRPVVFNGVPVPPANPNGLAPVRGSALDCLVPLLTLNDLPAPGAPMILRTFDEIFYVDARASDVDGFVANPALAADQVNALLILVPKASATPARSLRPARPKAGWPALALPAGTDSIVEYVAGILSEPLQMTKVTDPKSSGEIELLYPADALGTSPAAVQGYHSAIVLALSRGDLSALQEFLGANAPVYGTPMLSLVREGTHRDDSTDFLGFGLSLSFLSGAQTVTRVTKTPPTAVYSYESL